MRLRHSDVIVVGGGIMGSSATFFLKRRGLSVSLVERDLVGQHASGTNFGNVRRQGRLLYQLPLANRASEVWRQAHSLLETDVEYRQEGHIRVTYGSDTAAEERMETYAREAAQYGLRLEILRGEALRQQFPFFGMEVAAGSLSPEDGHANPRLVSPAFARAAKRLGAGIFENTRITAVEKVGEDFLVTSEDGGLFRAPVLLITTGVWASELTAQFGEPVPMTSFGPTMSVTEPVTHSIKPGVGVYTAVEKESVYFRQIERGNVIIGGSTRGIGYPNTGKTPVHPSNVVSQFQQLYRVAPALTKLTVIRTWSGTEGYLPDSQPVLGASEKVPGLFYGFGFSGGGFQIGPGVGETLAELIATGRTEIDLSHYRLSRFSPENQQ